MSTALTHNTGELWRDGPIALVDVLDRVLARGVVVTGDITISIADVDLIRVSLRALIASVTAGHASHQEGTA